MNFFIKKKRQINMLYFLFHRKKGGEQKEETTQTKMAFYDCLTFQGNKFHYDFLRL